MLESTIVRLKVNKYDESLKFPYPITKVCKNGTVTMHRWAVQERMSIIWIKYYHE